MKKQLPTEPGLYYWTEWRVVVDVKKTRAGRLHFEHNGIKLKVTPRLAGRLLPPEAAIAPSTNFERIGELVSELEDELGCAVMVLTKDDFPGATDEERGKRFVEHVDKISARAEMFARDEIAKLFP